MKSILITGASSYLGKSLTAALIKEGHKVYPAVNSNSSGFYNEIKLKLPNFDRSVLPSKVDIIVHLAAKTGSRIPEGDQEAFEVNVEGTLRLAQYAKQANTSQFIYFSTASVYKPGGILTEDKTPVSPRNFYSLTKWLGEETVRYYSKYFNTLVLRLSYPYGPGDTKSLIGRIFNRMKLGQKIQIHLNGKPTLNPIYIDDLILAAKKGINLNGNLTINLAGLQALTVQQITNLLAKNLNVKPEFEYTNIAEEDQVVDISLMEKYLVRPKVKLDKGLRLL